MKLSKSVLKIIAYSLVLIVFVGSSIAKELSHQTPIQQKKSSKYIRLVMNLTELAFLPELSSFFDQFFIRKPPLPSFNANLYETSVSGSSAGGFMAGQFHIAHSKYVKGAGIFSAGPYRCSKNLIPLALKNCFRDGEPDVDFSISAIKRNSNQELIDNYENLKNDRIFLFSGGNDSFLGTQIVDSVYDQYKYFMPEENILYSRNEVPAGHSMITDGYGAPCSAQTGEFINDCGFDAAGILLKHIYGDLNPPSEPKGELISFSQVEFTKHSLSSMAPIGFVYVPSQCLKRDMCKIHVVFHGCLQSYVNLDNSYYKQLGYNEWGESNNIIILYPQAFPSKSIPYNPMACWDWWGYSSTVYYTKKAPQIKAVMRMVKRLAGARLDE